MLKYRHTAPGSPMRLMRFGDFDHEPRNFGEPLMVFERLWRLVTMVKNSKGKLSYVSNCNKLFVHSQGTFPLRI